MPELLVTDLDRSFAFWCGLVGFHIRYDRPETRFAMLGLGTAAVMLEERQAGTRHWITGPLDAPFGRGLNFSIEVPEAAPVLARLGATGWLLFIDVEDAWYRAGAIEIGQRQFLVQDPDGYLLRLAEPLGERPFSCTT